MGPVVAGIVPLGGGRPSQKGHGKGRMNTAPELQVDTWLTPHGRGTSRVTRPGTSDWNTVSACNGSNDEYHLPEGLQGWALDVGAHIGALTVPLLVDNPGLRAVAIEALPENVELLRMNLERNGV